MTISSLRAHQFEVNDKFWCFHTPNLVAEKDKLTIAGKAMVVKKIIRQQRSRYFKGNLYYEIEVD